MRCMGAKTKMLTPRQYASLHGVAYTTVMNWLQNGKIPQAVKTTTPTGHFWEIPEDVETPEMKRGRPSKAQDAALASAPNKASRKRAGKKGNK